VIVVRVLVFIAGVAVVVATLGSAMRTVILPRGVPARLARVVFLWMRAIFRLRARPSASYERRDRVMALYAPLSLLVLLMVWVFLVMAGFIAMFWALGGRSWATAFESSGSSIFTLGFVNPGSAASDALAFVEAGLGLVLLAMLITYLPSIYQAFSRREALVTALEVRAGSPPSGVRIVEFFHVMGQLDRLTDFWEQWENWFVDIEETQTSFPALTFFRSPQPDHSWVTAAGAVLDGAALFVSCVDAEREAQAEFAIRAGYLALRHIADFYRYPYPMNPHFPEQQIAVAREEFDEAWDRMEASGVPMKPDRDRAWQDFAGWRVNYDLLLIALATITMAPFAPWSSDRGVRDWRPPILAMWRLPRRIERAVRDAVGNGPEDSGGQGS
jgi:hypothetical protein